ncbi:MAG: hypothetical protein HZA84_02580 [Thaumarchaeota archaeon]|nr:hypothetical protein [Nitrososphaerota archaeon]
MTYKTKLMTSKKFNTIITSTIIAALAIATTMGSAHALAYHATHDLTKSTGAIYPVTPDIYGIKSTYKVLDTSIASGQALLAPSWATLSAGIYREVGWSDQGSDNIHAYYAIDGQKKTPVNYNISNNVEYTFEVSNVNKDYTWDLVAPGIAKQWTSFVSAKASVINTGYEFTASSVTLPTNTFKNQYVYVNTAWALWSDQVNGLTGETESAGHYVLECGVDYKTQHGEGSGPPSC